MTAVAEFALRGPVGPSTGKPIAQHAENGAPGNHSIKRGMIVPSLKLVASLSVAANGTNVIGNSANPVEGPTWPVRLQRRLI